MPRILLRPMPWRMATTSGAHRWVRVYRANHLLDVEVLARLSGTPAIEHGAWIHEQGALRRLPQMLEELRALRKRVEALESTTDHR